MRHSVTIVAAGSLVLSSSLAFAQFVQQGTKLVGTGATGVAMQGQAVALSADGNTAIVGGPNDNSGLGAAWIFTRSGSTWAQQGGKLVGSAAVGAANEGYAVALSADGNTAVIGGYQDNSNVGAAWIFVRSGGVWAQQGGKLVGTAASGASLQGVSVAISGDGNTVVVGGFGDNSFVGAAWVFTRSGSTWAQQGTKLVGTGASGTSRQGVAVSLSADGNVTLSGGSGDNSNAGAAWIFVRAGTTWSQSGGKLTGTGASGSAAFGQSAALSADGLNATIGGNNDNSSAGAVWVFTKSGASWSQQGTKLVGTGASGTPVYQGKSVAVSALGNVFVEGGYGDGGTPAAGAAWIFTRSLGAWTQLGSKLVGSAASNGSNGSNQGFSVGMSSDGQTAIVGGYRDNSDVGAAWILTATSPSLPTHATGDLDNDHKADMTVITTAGDWTTRTSGSGYSTSMLRHFLLVGYVPSMADYDGDGRQDLILYDQATGNWQISTSTTNYSGLVGLFLGGPGYIAVPGDYDGDGHADPAVYNTTTGAWKILKSNTNYSTIVTINWGGPGYTPIPNQDFDRDGVADIAVYQVSSGNWSVLKSSTGFTTTLSVNWGGPGYALAPGDYDGDGRTDLGLYQRSTGWWYILKSSANYTTTLNVSWGGVGYVPVPGDYDGDGKTDLGLYQRTTGNYYVLLSGASFTTSINVASFAAPGSTLMTPALMFAANDLIRAGDFDGDTQTDITVYNTTSGVWSALTSTTGYAGATNRGWGGPGYVAVPGDYDGDGRADLGVYYQPTGTWYVLLSAANFTTTLTKSVGGLEWLAEPGDYDGDGKTDFVVYNRNTGQWYGLLSGSNYTTTLNVMLGGGGSPRVTNVTPQYLPVPEDYDGDGKTDIAVYFWTSGTWSVLYSSTNYTTGFSKTISSTANSPVPADYDGDGKADLIAYENATGRWIGLLSGAGYTTTLTTNWGGIGYLPVRGDFDGDGRADFAAYDGSSGAWVILLSGANSTTTLTRNWGGPSYQALPAYPH